ncbi:hypothetical protein JOD54_000484 [Actinokineospora baliensis]|uniref:WXG100 family type VII secretion target n=1 Tax=Actinokineospora baliensis TaxID=547056 RepID=UPI00195AB1D2|nr:hypothetical protein [Actinokineospora baliensis]MBM7770280.1 hypothetical protein [Actinokineospora baliensis]
MTAGVVREVLVEPVREIDLADVVVDGGLAGVRLALSTREGGAVFQRWRDHPAAAGGWRQETWGPRDERLIDDLRGTDFGALSAAAERLASIADAAGAVRDGAAGLRGRLADTWGGRGADLAAGRFDEFAVKARGWQESSVRLAAAVDGAREVVRTALRGWAEQADTVRGLEVDHLPTRLTQIDRLDGAVRANPVDLLRSRGAHELNAPGEEPWPTAEVIEYLDGYCARYEAAIARFRRDLAAVHKATTDAWGLFASLLPERSTVDSPVVEVTARPDSVAVAVDGKQYVIDGLRRPPPQTQPAEPTPAAQSPVPQTPPAQQAPAHSGGNAPGTPSVREPGPGAATGAEVPPSAEPQRQPAAAVPAAATSGQSGFGGGGGMMGGMGGMGGQGGGDSERKSSQWKLVGSLFDEEDPAARFGGVVGEDPANRARG